MIIGTALQHLDGNMNFLKKIQIWKTQIQNEKKILNHA